MPCSVCVLHSGAEHEPFADSTPQADPQPHLFCIVTHMYYRIYVILIRTWTFQHGALLPEGLARYLIAELKVHVGVCTELP